MPAPRLSELLELGALPVINENDTVATTEIRYGDNDRLAARVAQMTSADCLLLLSDVAGLYTADPNLDPTARLIPEVREITPGDRSHGWRLGIGRGLGRHGHQDRRGEDRHRGRLRHGHRRGRAHCIPVRRLEEGAECSWFLPASESRECAQAVDRRVAAPQWCRDHRRGRPAGAALGQEPAAGRRGRRSSGRFARGDTVSVLDRDGNEIARGMIAYSDRDAARIIGKRSADIEALLGFRGRDEMIHRDDLVHDARRSRACLIESREPMNAAVDQPANPDHRRRHGLRSGREAVAAAAVLALASTATKNRGAGDDRRRVARAQRRSC